MSYFEMKMTINIDYALHTTTERHIHRSQLGSHTTFCLSALNIYGNLMRLVNGSFGFIYFDEVTIYYYQPTTIIVTATNATFHQVQFFCGVQSKHLPIVDYHIAVGYWIHLSNSYSLLPDKVDIRFYTM